MTPGSLWRLWCVLAASLLILLLVCCSNNAQCATVSGAKEVGFRLDADRAYSSLYYQSTYTNLDDAELGTLYAFVSPGLVETSLSLSGPRGCNATKGTCAAVLVPLEATPTLWWYICITDVAANDEVTRAGCLASAMEEHAGVPRDALRASGYDIALVVTTASAADETGGLDYAAVVHAIDAYNRHEAEAKTSPSVTTLLTSSQGWRATTDERGATLPLANGSFVFFDSTTGENDGWGRVVTHAAFNSRRWTLGYTFPMSVVEVRNPVPPLASSPVSCLHATSAAAESTCLPLGGWTLWSAVNVDTMWNWNASTRRFVPTTPVGATALFVPTSMPNQRQSGSRPDAAGPASAIVAALVAVDAVRRLSSTLSISPPLYVFLVPGEWTGNVGSSRLLYDAYNPPLCAERGPDACTALLYGAHLNATTLDFEHVARVVTVDHLHVPPTSLDDAQAPLCFHVDGRVNQTAANQKLTQDLRVLEKVHLVRRNETVLKSSPSSIFTQFRGQNSPGNISAMTISSMCDAANVSDNVVRHLSASTSTTTATTREHIQKAALAITQLVLADTRASNGGDAAELTLLDDVLVDELYDCFANNFSCSFLGLGDSVSSRPDYAFGAFGHGVGRDLEVALRAALKSLSLPPLTTLAVSPRLAVPTQAESLNWTWNDMWSSSEPSSLDAVLVESVVPASRGVRLTIVSSRSASHTAFLLALLSVIAVSLLLFVAHRS